METFYAVQILNVVFPPHWLGLIVPFSSLELLMKKLLW